MLKISSKRRRTLKEIQAEKLAKEQETAQTAAKLAQFDQLQEQMEMLQREAETGKMANNLMGQFLDAGVIKQMAEDEFVVNSSPNESKFKAFPDH